MEAEGLPKRACAGPANTGVKAGKKRQGNCRAKKSSGKGAPRRGMAVDHHPTIRAVSGRWVLFMVWLRPKRSEKGIVRGGGPHGGKEVLPARRGLPSLISALGEKERKRNREAR